MYYSSIKELIQLAEKNKTTISDIVLRSEADFSELSINEIHEKMLKNLEVMKNAVKQGRENTEKTESGLTGGEALQMKSGSDPFASNIYREAVINALAVAGVNAGMGKIVACPTAGSCGILPGVMIALQNNFKLTDAATCKGLFTASGLGEVVAQKATLSGAAGGCQAECGVASAMAAGAGVELMQGTPRMVGHAFALALKNLLGLACDPVAGLVEVPCVKRNGFAASHALTAAHMALAGIESVIPPDEVIAAMKDIGDRLPASLKETSEAGLADTPTGREIRLNIKC